MIPLTGKMRGIVQGEPSENGFFADQALFDANSFFVGQVGPPQHLNSFAPIQLASVSASASSTDEILHRPEALIQIGTDYVVSGNRWAQNVITWSFATANYDNQQSVTFESKFPDGSTERSLITQAINIWDNALANISFQQVADSGEANVRFGWGYGLTADGAATGNVLGETSNFTSGTNILYGDTYGTLTRSLIRIDRADTYSDLGGSPTTDKPFLNVALHEVGHAIGLAHYDLNPAIMNTYATNMTSLTSHETNGGAFLYPGGDSSSGGQADYTAALTNVGATTVSPGQTVAVNFRISNTSIQQGEGPSWKLFFSQDQSIDPVNETVDRDVGTGYVLERMAGNSSVNLSTTFVVPDGISGTWYLAMVVDYGNYLGETNNDNNISNFYPFTVAGGAVSAGSISISDVTLTEGDSGSRSAAFTVTRSGGTAAFAVNFATSDGGATTADNDYVANSGTLNFAAGVNTQQISVTVNGDTRTESDEAFFVNLSAPTNGATISDNLGIGTITNDDVGPAVAGSISITDVTVAEGNSGTRIAAFTVTRSGGTAAFAVNFATSDGGATTADSDYVANSGTLNFAAGVNTQQISVTVNGDTRVESDEAFFVTLSAATNGATISDNLGIGTITNDDVAPAVAGSISISDVAVTEGNTGTTAATFTVVRSGGTAPFNVNYLTADGTATVADGDYAAATGTLEFGAGVNSRTFSVLVNGDTKIEPNEVFYANLSGATNGATIADNQGFVFIGNDDAAPGSISISDVAVTEGNSGTTTATFTVVRSGGTAAFNVNYLTADGTATLADGDYVPATGTLEFGPDVNSRTFSVLVNGDTKIEPNEVFYANLSGATNGATIADNQGFVFIGNDDAAPAVAGSISISDVAVTEGNSGTTAATFTVVRSGGTAAFNVNYLTADGTATLADGDYAPATGTLEFGPGVNSRTFSVLVNGDTKFEPNEVFYANLSGATNGATIADNQGFVFIGNDDTPVAGSISISDVAVTEGNSGTTTATFTVVRSGGTAAFNVNYLTADGTATLADGDYAPATGTLEFGPDVNSRTFSVLVNGDTKFEPNEVFYANLSGATNGAIIADNQGFVFIGNDDTPVAGSISISDVAVTEGNNGTTAATFTVVRSGGTAAFNVNYLTADGTATLADGDYAPATGTLEFGPDVNSRTFSVLVNGDTKFEPNEVFYANLSGATNGATIADNQGFVFIGNDDTPAGSISITDVAVTEGNSGTTAATFTVVRSGGTAAFNVNYLTADGTATLADGDYAPATGTLEFGAGVNSRTFSVLVNGDTKIEPNEVFYANLSGATNGATIADNQGFVFIGNDDTPAVAGSISISDVAVNEGDSGATTATFTVVRSGGTAAFNVNYLTADGTATLADGDYAPATGTLEFGPGVNSRTFSVLVNGDTKFEPNEVFYANLSGATNAATIADNQGYVFIGNDDAAPGSLSISDVAVTEGNSGTTTATFTVVRSGGTAAFNVNYLTADGTATLADGDYAPATGTLEFGPGVNSRTFSVLVNGDIKFEPNEVFYANLSGATNGATFTDNQGYVFIGNDDAAPGSISISDVAVTEGNSGTTTATFTVVRSGGTAAFNVNYLTADGTATLADGDYAPATGTLEFGAGVNSRTFSVLVNGDTKIEPNEVFYANLSGATNGATIADNQGFAFIGNDDFHNDAPVIAVPQVNVSGHSGQPLQVASLFSASDVNGDPLTYYLFDNSPDPSSGHFLVNGVVIPAQETAVVSAAQLLQTTFEPGAVGGFDNLYFVVSDGQLRSDVGYVHVEWLV